MKFSFFFMLSVMNFIKWLWKSYISEKSANISLRYRWALVWSADGGKDEIQLHADSTKSEGTSSFDKKVDRRNRYKASQTSSKKLCIREKFAHTEFG